MAVRIARSEAAAGAAAWPAAVPAGVLVVVVLFAVAHVRRYFFLFDDYALVHLASTTPAGTIWTSPLIGFYRPAAFLFLGWETARFSWGAPGGYAAVSMAVHLANAVPLAYVIGFVLPRQRGAAALWLSFFLLSPWAGETYFWASGQFDLLGTFFASSALALGLWASVAERHRTFIVRVALVLLLAAAAVLCKEAYVALPAAFLGLSTCRIREEPGMVRTRVLVVTGAMVLSVGGYLIARVSFSPRWAGPTAGGTP
jgi:hypothetical protein